MTNHLFSSSFSSQQALCFQPIIIRLSRVLDSSDYKYDAIGRTLSVVAPDNQSTTTYVYQGNQTTVTDPAGKWKTTVSDAQRNTVEVIEPDPASTSGGTLPTYYYYDTLEHLKQVTMPRSSGTQTRYFNYDGTTHLLTSETHPETGTTSYTYTPDAFTNDLLTSKTDAKGQVTKYTYDSYYRITAINRYTNATNFGSNTDDPCQRVSYAYDTLGGIVNGFNAQNAWGHLVATVTGDQSCIVVPADPGLPQVQQQFTELYSYAYGSGRVAQKRLQAWEEEGGDPAQQHVSFWDLSYTYNQFGQVSTMTYPKQYLAAAPILTTGYDNMQRPNTLAISYGTTMVSGVTYNASNQPLVTSFNGPGAYTESRVYNALNQLVTLTGPNLNIAYTYDNSANNGQITHMTDNVLGQTTNYTYDAMKRLSHADSYIGSALQWYQQYDYDGFGNMTGKNGMGGLSFTNTVDVSTNRLSFGNFCYDPNGDPVSDQNGGGCGNPNYVYDIGNRMVTAKLSNGYSETYQYNADNKRQSKITFMPANGYGSTYIQTIYVYGRRERSWWWRRIRLAGRRRSPMTTVSGVMWERRRRPH